jgi:hypothetical protein
MFLNTKYTLQILPRKYLFRVSFKDGLKSKTVHGIIHIYFCKIPRTMIRVTVTAENNNVYRRFIKFVRHSTMAVFHRTVHSK